MDAEIPLLREVDGRFWLAKTQLSHARTDHTNTNIAKRVFPSRASSPPSSYLFSSSLHLPITNIVRTNSAQSWRRTTPRRQMTVIKADHRLAQMTMQLPRQVDSVSTSAASINPPLCVPLSPSVCTCYKTDLPFQRRNHDGDSSARTLGSRSTGGIRSIPAPPGRYNTTGFGRGGDHRVAIPLRAEPSVTMPTRQAPARSTLPESWRNDPPAVSPAPPGYNPFSAGTQRALDTIMTSQPPSREASRSTSTPDPGQQASTERVAVPYRNPFSRGGHIATLQEGHAQEQGQPTERSTPVSYLTPFPRGAQQGQESSQASHGDPATTLQPRATGPAQTIRRKSAQESRERTTSMPPTDDSSPVQSIEQPGGVSRSSRTSNIAQSSTAQSSFQARAPATIGDTPRERAKARAMAGEESLLAKLQRDIEDLEAQNKKLSQMNNSLTSSNSILRTTNQHLNRRLDDLEAQLGQKDKEMETMSTSMRQLSRENESLKRPASSGTTNVPQRQPKIFKTAVGSDVSGLHFGDMPPDDNFDGGSGPSSQHAEALAMRPISSTGRGFGQLNPEQATPSAASREPDHPVQSSPPGIGAGATPSPANRETGQPVQASPAGAGPSAAAASAAAASATASAAASAAASSAAIPQAQGPNPVPDLYVYVHEADEEEMNAAVHDLDQVVPNMRPIIGGEWPGWVQGAFAKLAKLKSLDPAREDLMTQRSGGIHGVQCMAQRAKNQGSVYVDSLNGMQDKKYACKQCSGSGTPCLRVSGRNLILAPLHPDLRSTEEKSEVAFYMDDRFKVPNSNTARTREFTNLGNLWTEKKSAPTK